MRIHICTIEIVFIITSSLLLSACTNNNTPEKIDSDTEASSSEIISRVESDSIVSQTEFSSDSDTSDNQKGESDTVFSLIEDNSQIEKGTAASNDKPDSASEITVDESTINLADFKAKLDLTDFGELDDDTLEKLSRLRPNMTSSEVYEVLGEADEHAPTGIAWDYFYINGNKNRWIKVGYFDDTIDVQIGDAELHKGFDLFERLYGISDQ